MSIADLPRVSTELAAAFHACARAGDLLPQYRVANTACATVKAWRIVYDVYVQKGLIDPNPFGVHASPQAIKKARAVITDLEQNVTLTSMGDSELGLPLDSLYADHLSALRREGRCLAEIGLFADRGDNRYASVEALFAVMAPALAWCFNAYGASDVVIGVHPHHARFYARAFGFEVIGGERSYAAVNDHPCVLLRLVHSCLRSPRPTHRGAVYYATHPTPPGVFSCRSDDERDHAYVRFLETYAAYKEGRLNPVEAEAFATALLAA